ncbi:SNF2_N domain-containing protein/Helicase_C domain-containing protein [Cephalotus follicularis]|uniref:SNF2_N domain-containing protein/Helicase_C domain-containing protein n=1 Tax=Cephalotus follicularis TaxID=3775 RepID=A0A1Q3B9S2_CEPFO|nr:SNF2_N domain-containing protein/Helicase_C domain-containing protein [Cephalotus follicularis]
MQSAGGGGGGGGTSRNTAGRATSTSSAAASPSSSSSAVSTPHLGFDSMQQHHHQQQQQQQQQLGSRQSLQHQLLRKPDGNEAILAYQAGGLQGMMGGNNFASSPGSMQPPQQSRKFFDLAQQHGSPQEGQNRSQGVEQHVLNPVHQAYLQYAFQAAQQRSALAMQAKMGMMGPASGKDQDLRMGNLKMQELMSMQAAHQAQTSSSKNSSEPFARVEKQIDQGQQPTSDQRNEPKPPAQQMVVGHPMPANIMRPMQAPQGQQSIQNMGNNQLAMAAQMQAVQAWALERNIDLSLPANANLMAQLIPLMQSKMAVQQTANEISTGVQSSPVPVSKQQVTSPRVARESSPHANSSSDVSGQSGSAKTRQTVPPGPFVSTSNSGMGNNANNVAMQQFSVQSRENQLPPRQSALIGNGMPPMHPPQSSANMNQLVDQSLAAKNSSGPENLQMQYLRQINRSSPQSSAPSSDGGLVNHLPSHGGPTAQMSPQRFGFTKQQLHVLKAQILAFRRLKKGEGTLPQELLRAIAPPPLELQLQQQILSAGGNNQDRSAGKIVEDQLRHSEPNEKDTQAVPLINGQHFPKEEAFTIDDKATASTVHMPGMPSLMKESIAVVATAKEEQPNSTFSGKLDPEVERGFQKTPVRSEFTADRGKSIAPQVAASDAAQAKKPVQTSTPPQPKDLGSARKYHGPLFDFPFFTRKHDSFGSAATTNNNNSLTLAYDVKDLLFEEGVEVLDKKRSESLKKISGLLAVNLERKRIRPDLVLRLQIEEKKLRLVDLQARLRDEVDHQQQEIMAMPDRPYRKFVRLCERQRMDLARQIQVSQRAMREKQLKSIFQWRKRLLEAHWAIRDARTARNRGVGKYHERILREFSKRKDDDRNKRMEALKNNDVERYREMLLEQQTNIQGDAAERYAVLSSFLSQTEEYLHKLGSKITAAKNQQEVEEAANAATAAARLQGLSEEEVRVAAACAGEEVMIRNRFMEMNAPKDSSSVSKYYTLAHAVNERVLRQPSMLRAGILRDYQLVGLQWMLSLYNNKLNGILADEMGLGKTVQVMALVAYLMEFKGNYGPHLIIVPNAVLVNWKSELHTWLPSVSCIYYVGGKDQRSKLFSQEVSAMKFNVLVTTYEFIMYDRSKLSKIDWKYIIIDEAQRMKDRESVLARDLDRYRCQRRLLLTGTPLQNDLKELWSLLNLLLPEVFDNRKAFHDWFSKPFQKEAPTHNAEDDWLETEKKVIIIHRLHQILEPFMLRRRVEDVEGSLPPKVSIVLRCRMSAMQGAIYDWIKSTGTLRVDPEDEKRRAQKNPIYQAKVYKTLNNRCMELRKACNHPLLNYPYFNDFSKDFLVRSCGKLWVMDRILIKLQRTGHRVLLFSTMTKLLDILEEYLQWRRLLYRRIDGTTSLEDRESAIVDFNSPNSDCFIFLLSIRAAGRGLNLQSADTVIIYDPDPNPKNEEQAVARAHRIGQTREVKVIYMEAVVDKISSHQKEDELRSGGTVDLEDDLVGKDRYMGSIESLIRNNIQQYKIDMADEVINAGRFDQRTTHEERRMTLETLLHDDERYQETVHDVPSLQEVNRMIARSKQEVDLFDQMDEDLDWAGDMTRYDQVPTWLRASTKEVNTTIANLSKKPSKSTIFASSIGVESSEMETERKRGRPKGKKHPNYKEVDDENGEYSEASSDERNGYSVPEEEGEIAEYEDDEFSGAAGVPPVNKDQSEEDGPVCDGDYEYPRPSESIRNNHNILEEAGSSGSSSDNRRLTRMVSPVSPQKFGSLSALDARPSSHSRRLPDELEEGEIAVSGDSHMDLQQSGSWIHDREEGEDEQVLQPKFKRKRSIRIRPRQALERPEEKGNEMPSLQRGDSALLPFQVDHKHQAQLRTDIEAKSFGELNAFKHNQNDSSPKSRRNLPSRRIANTSKLHASPKSGRFNSMSIPAEDAAEHSRETGDGKVMNTSGPPKFAAKMSDVIQRRCKNVISKLQRRIAKEGSQIIPLLKDLWKKVDESGYVSGAGNNLFDLRKVDQRVDRFEYKGVVEFVSDVQFMLRSAMHFYGFSHEVRNEARKVHDLFFDILKIAFPGTDLREVRIALSFSIPVSTSASVPSPREATVGLSKRQKTLTEVEPDPSPPQKALQRGSSSSVEDTRVRVHVPPKESRLGSGSGSSREQSQPDDSPLLTHPGELVICKKKRKDREKSVVKPRTGSTGPVSPPSMGRPIRSPGPGSIPKEERVAQQTTHQQGWGNQPAQPSNGGGGGAVGWANPVKRLRTDAGKRRPSHL